MEATNGGLGRKGKLAAVSSAAWCPIGRCNACQSTLSTSCFPQVRPETEKRESDSKETRSGGQKESQAGAGEVDAGLGESFRVLAAGNRAVTCGLM